MNKLVFRILFLLYVAGVLLLCFGKFDSTPSVPLELWGIPTDKLVHFGMFLPFPVLAYMAFGQKYITIKAALLFTGVTFIVGLLLALGTEWGQAHLTEYRSGDPWDFLADAIALATGSLLVLHPLRKFYSKKGHSAAQRPGHN